MATAQGERDEPLWIRRPEVLHLLAYGLAALMFLGQLVAVVVTRSDAHTLLAVLLGGAGALLSWWYPWPGLVVTSAASFAVMGAGRDPLPVWMMAVLVLFSFTLRGRRPVAGTALVVVFFLAAFMSVGGFRGGAVEGAAALFSGVAGGATGAALRSFREHRQALEEKAELALATSEAEATRRVVEERLRIARDLHDVIGHQVAMLSVHLGVAEIGLPADAESSRRALVSARNSGRTVVVETQRILELLRRGGEGSEEAALLPVPALSGLAELIASFRGIGLDVDASLDVPSDSDAPAVGLTVYRIVQESLTNAYRYGEGTVTVEVRADAATICVTVENAIGSGRSRAGGRLGLVSMRERVESAGGRLVVDDDGARFRVHAELQLLGVGVS